MKMIVGLGNPGRPYENTRHNVGFMVIDRLSGQSGISINKKDWNAVYGKGTIKGEDILLVKPVTFMNLSGQAVQPMLDWYKLTVSDLIVLCDDIHLPLGQLRIRSGGSDGGHNGLASIIRQLGNPGFTRIRMGVDEPPPGFNQADFVLGKFTRQEAGEVEEMVLQAAEAVELIMASGIKIAMNRFNAKKNKSTGEDSL